MSIDEILNRATINFPKPISFANTEKLLLSISEGIRGEVHYSLDTPKSFIYNQEEKKSRITLKDRMIKQIYIKDINNHSFESAKMIMSDEKSSEFSSMRFEIIPGYNLPDYRKETLQLWDDVREIVERYFSED